MKVLIYCLLALICFAIMILGVACIVVGSRKEQLFRESVIDDNYLVYKN